MIRQKHQGIARRIVRALRFTWPFSREGPVVIQHGGATGIGGKRRQAVIGG